MTTPNRAAAERAAWKWLTNTGRMLSASELQSGVDQLADIVEAEFPAPTTPSVPKIGSEKEGFERFSFAFSSPSLVNWLIVKGAPEGFSEFVLEKGMGERLDVHIRRPFDVTLVFYVPNHRKDLNNDN